MKNMPVLTFEAFQAMLSELLNVEASRITPEAYLVTDLGLDSIRLVELLLRLEALGVELSPELAWRIQTVADAYHYYQEQADQ
jgi:acyl carrier protein